MKKKIAFLTVFLLLLITAVATAAFNTDKVKELDYQVLTSYHHDPDAFTQGLEIYNDNLYEGTGLYGRSSLRKVKIKNGKILEKISLDKKYFGEGITILNSKIYQLSWKENIAFVYDLNFNLIKTFDYQGEGWGLANNGQQLIMSNGSEYVYFRNPNTFKITKKEKIKVDNKVVKNLNELEYHNGFIYANIWQSDYILKINAENGKVEAYLDLTNILKTDYNGKIGVLNGIAYDPKNNNFLITGKLWPKIYRIDIQK